MQLIFFQRFLPKRLRSRLRSRWSALLSWEQYLRERRFYRQFVRRGHLIFDVGANRGLKTAAFLSLGARVVAIEPNPVCANYMRSNFSRALQTGRLRVEELAAASEPGEIVLTVFDSDAAMCSGSAEFLKYAEEVGYESARKVKTKATTLDALVEKFGVPVFIKIDAEGMDADVMRGLSQRPQFLSFEFNTAARLWEDTRECFGHASRLGFAEANFTVGIEPKLQSQSWIGIRDMLSRIETLGRSDDLWGDVIVR